MLRYRSRRIHGWIGIVLALAIVWLGITGTLLEFSTRLGLDRAYVSSAWILDAYGIRAPRDATQLVVGGVTISRCDDRILVDDVGLDAFHAPLMGVVAEHDHLWVANADEAVMVDGQANVLDRVIATTDLGERIEALGRDRAGEPVAIGESRALSLTTLSEVARTNVAPVHMDLKTSDLAQAACRRGLLSWERVAMDAHAFRFLGAIGPAALATVALLFLVLAASGARLFRHRHRLHRYHRRER